MLEWCRKSTCIVSRKRKGGREPGVTDMRGKWEWEFAVAHPRSGLSSIVSRSNWNLEMLVFVQGQKPENPAKNPLRRDENQQQTQQKWEVQPPCLPHSLIINMDVPQQL